MGFRFGKILLVLAFASGGDGAGGAPAASTKILKIWCKQSVPCLVDCQSWETMNGKEVPGTRKVAPFGDKMVCLASAGPRQSPGEGMAFIPTLSAGSGHATGGNKCTPAFPTLTKVNDGNVISNYTIWWASPWKIENALDTLSKVTDSTCCHLKGAPQEYSARWLEGNSQCVVTKPTAKKDETTKCKSGEQLNSSGDCACKEGYIKKENECVAAKPTEKPAPEQAAAALPSGKGFCPAGQVAVYDDFSASQVFKCVAPPTYTANTSGQTYDEGELHKIGLDKERIKNLNECGASGALDSVRNITSVDVKEVSSGTVYKDDYSAGEDISAHQNDHGKRNVYGQISGRSEDARKTDELLKSGKLIDPRRTQNNYVTLPDSGKNFKEFCEYIYKRMVIIAALNQQAKDEANAATNKKGQEVSAEVKKSTEERGRIKDIYDKTNELAKVGKKEVDSLIGKQEAQIKELEEARAAKAKATDLVKNFTIEGEQSCYGVDDKFSLLKSEFARNTVREAKAVPVCGYLQTLNSGGNFPPADRVLQELTNRGLQIEQIVAAISEKEKGVLIERDQQLGQKKRYEEYLKNPCSQPGALAISEQQAECLRVQNELNKILSQTIPTLNKDLALLSADREKIKGVSIDYKAEIKRASLLWGKNADGLAILKTYEEEDKKQQAMLKSLQDTISKEKAENEQTSFNTMDAISKLKKMADDLFGGKPGEGMNFDPGQFDPGGPPPAPGPTVDDIMGNAVIGNDSPVAFSPPVNNGPPAGSISDGRGVVGRVGGGSGGGNPSLEDLYHSLATNNPADPDASLGSTEQNLLKPFTPEAAGVIGDARAPKGNTAREKVPLSNRKPGNAPAGQGGSGGGLAGGSGGGGPNKKMNAGEEAGPQFVGNLPNMNYNGTSGGVAPLSFGGGGEGGGSGTDFAAVMPTEADFSKKDAAGLEALDSSKVGAGRVAAATDGLAGIGESIFKIVSDGYLRKQINWKGK